MIATIPQSPATIELPNELHLQIGRLITIFSAIEHEVRLITAVLLRITPQEARLTVRTPRIKDSFEMIHSLMGLYELKVTHDLKALQQELAELEGARDWVAHGVWTKLDGVLHLMISSGSWKPPGFKLPIGKSSIQRRVIPAAAPATADQIKQIADVGVELLPIVADVCRQLSDQRQSPD